MPLLLLAALCLFMEVSAVKIIMSYKIQLNTQMKSLLPLICKLETGFGLSRKNLLMKIQVSELFYTPLSDPWLIIL